MIPATNFSFQAATVVGVSEAEEALDVASAVDFMEV